MGQGRLKEAAEVLAKAPANSQDEALTMARALQLYYERRFDKRSLRFSRTRLRRLLTIRAP